VELTFDQVKQAGRHAYRDDVENHYMLWYDPDDSSLWLAARTRPYPEVGEYGYWAPFKGDPPTDGWYHPRQPCGCEFCNG
jgi:hypothetical protein